MFFHVSYPACNVISQSPEGSYTIVIPQQHRNCSFSIIYPVEIDISEFSLGQFNRLPKVSTRRSCQHRNSLCSTLFPLEFIIYNGLKQTKNTSWKFKLAKCWYNKWLLKDCGNMSFRFSPFTAASIILLWYLVYFYSNWTDLNWLENWPVLIYFIYLFYR